MSRLRTAPIAPLYSLKSIPLLPFNLRLQRQNGLCPPDISIKKPIRISLPSRWGQILCPPQLLCLVHPRYIQRGAQIMQPLIMQFLQAPVSPSHLGTNIFLSTLQTERRSSR